MSLRDLKNDLDAARANEVSAAERDAKEAAAARTKNEENRKEGTKAVQERLWPFLRQATAELKDYGFQFEELTNSDQNPIGAAFSFQDKATYILEIRGRYVTIEQVDPRVAGDGDPPRTLFAEGGRFVSKIDDFTEEKLTMLLRSISGVPGVTVRQR